MVQISLILPHVSIVAAGPCQPSYTMINCIASHLSSTFMYEGHTVLSLCSSMQKFVCIFVDRSLVWLASRLKLVALELWFGVLGLIQ